MEFVLDAIKEIKSEMKSLRDELRAEMKELRMQMRSDFHLLFGAIITLGIGQAGLLARAFGWI
jgi:D-arabinose 5-phosphate isomerase GutQ